MHRRAPGGSCAARHRMRCSQGSKGCGSRFTLRRHPRLYRYPPKCPHCGSRHLQDVDAARRAETDNEDTCHCNAFPFPHRAGSMRMCHAHPLADTEPTPEEIDEYEGCLATPRTGYY